LDKKQFKSESKRLLDLMINSIYTHKEIFLRELISNASDAIDKLCFISLTDENVGLSRSDFKIEIKPDKEKGTLTIADNGIGMSKDDLENNLGTIASSGSYNFRQAVSENNKKDDSDFPPATEGAESDREGIELIGQFGVGFYSAFMVAKNITVISKKYGEDKAYKWESSGADGYTIEETEKENVGTEIILVLKDDTDDETYSEYLQQYKVSSIIKKYSDYIRFPIIMDMERTKAKPGTENNEKPEYETVLEKETINSMVPIWQKNKKDVTQEEYDNFYKEKFYDMDAPIHTIVTSVEGVVTYKALLYVPSKPPYNFYTKEYKPGLQLYSTGVMIMESCADLLPEHFRFVKGIVDSQDLSLNISRELLQHDRQLKSIAANIEKKIKNELEGILNNKREDYEKFFAAFGRQLKYGVVVDYGLHKDQIKDLLLFYSSTEKKLVTLTEYVNRMQEGQKYIYYALGENIQTLDKLPQAEVVREKNYEILYLMDEIDEFAIQSLRTYNEKEFCSVTNDDLGIEPDKNEETNEDCQTMLTFIKETLGDKVSSVIISKKLKSHPVCLTAQGGISFEMERYMNQVNPDGGIKAERVLELNTSHPAVSAIKSAIDDDVEKAKKYAEILYNQAVLIAGLTIENPSDYADLVCSLMY